MRTSSVEINNKKYLLCFSARVIRAFNDRYGDMENISAAISGDGQSTGEMLDNIMFMLSEMINAGARYAKLEGLDNPDPIGYDDLYDLCGIDDLSELKTSIINAVIAGNEREIEAEEEKNIKTTQKEK